LHTQDMIISHILEAYLPFTHPKSRRNCDFVSVVFEHFRNVDLAQ